MSIVKLKHNDRNHWDNIRHLVSVIEMLNKTTNSQIHISSSGFATPFQVIPLACFLNLKKLSYQINDQQSDLASYLNTIKFPQGVNLRAVTIGSSGNYLPIGRIHGSKRQGEVRDENYKQIEDQYRELVLNCFPTVRDTLSNAIAFFLSELIENAKDHSEANNFYVFAQYWPLLKQIELCMMDDGIGLRGSLAKRYAQITSDEIAVREVIQRQLSVRISEFEALPGTGLANTIRIVSNNELSSTFTIISGNYGFSSVNKNSRWIDLKETSLPGTLINIRIVEPNSRLNIFDYIQ
ncbi:MAG TPA: hypothetical protein DCE78_12900 [Bacteroidetes bacterium]|nr:hypothetical protein [Bacteroidota bacterium]